jgi:hypothetical protein
MEDKFFVHPAFACQLGAALGLCGVVGIGQMLGFPGGAMWGVLALAGLPMGAGLSLFLNQRLLYRR